MRISRRFINLIPSVRIARTRNTCIWKLRDTTWMSYMRSNFVKERNKKKSYLISRENHFFEIKLLIANNYSAKKR